MIKKGYSFALLALAAGFTLYGWMQQEQLLVMKKAVNICLECIGVG